MVKIKFLALFLLIVSITQADHALAQAAKDRFVFGAVYQEGIVVQEDSPSYRAAALTIKYLNAYLKAKNIDMRVYDKPQMGTYFETMDRLRKRRIDLAALPSFATVAAGGQVDFNLLGIIDYPKPWRTVLLTNIKSTVSDIRGLKMNCGDFKMVYVSELSASGYVIPKIYFTDMKMDFKEEVFSDGHLTSIMNMIKGEYGKNAVIAVDDYVYKEFKRRAPQQSALLKEIYAVENPMIFKDCIFASANVTDEQIQYLKEAMDLDNIAKVKDERLRKDLESLVGPIRSYIGFNNVVTDVDNSIFNYLETYISRYNFRFTERFAFQRVLEKIAEDIDDNAALDPAYKPKVAVVLSGGGASGSYQAGVLMAMEEQLKEFNRERRKGRRPITIDLVAGTSIGAFNALLYALGAVDQLKEFYINIKAKDLFTPYWVYRILKYYTDYLPLMVLMTIFAFYSFIYSVCLLARIRLSKLSPTRIILPALLLAALLISIGLMIRSIIPDILLWMILLCLGCIFYERFGFVEYNIREFLDKKMGEGSGAARTIGLLFSALLFILPIGVLVFIFTAWEKQNFWYIIAAALMAVYLLIKALARKKVDLMIGLSRSSYFRAVEYLSRLVLVSAGFFVIVYLMTFFRTGTAIFSDEGYETSYIGSLSEYVGDKIKLGKEELSQKILSGDIDREFVLTASDLRGRQEVYFYFHPRSIRAPYLPSGVTWVSLNKYPEKLVDALVASSSALVAFPLKEMKIGNKKLALTDGASMHQVPVDAATSLGATHLLIVLCVKDIKDIVNPEEWDFFQYLSGSVIFSVFGSQTLDYLSSEKRMSFMIAPRERKILKQDFEGKYYKGKYVSLKDFMEEGYNDAWGKGNGFREVSAGEFVLK